MLHRDELDRLRQGLSLRQRIGQCFIVGLAGEGILAEEKELIRTLAPGGFILFRRNLASPEQSRSLLAEIASLTQEACGVPPLFCADEEGDFVTQTDRFAEPLPSAMALAATGDVAAAAAAARWTGERLRWLGIPLNLAPVLDVNDEPANPVIGIRSFGARADLVARFGQATVEGFRQAGVFATGKHFPGHGSTTRDSHRDLPVVSHDRRRLDEVELAPFRRAMHAGLPIIMTAHVAYPQVDPAGERPATLCAPIIRGILRGEIGFKGIVMSDDLEMAAIRENFTPREVARLGPEAGLDMFLVAGGGQPALRLWEEMLEHLAAGRIESAEREESVSRVLALKREWLGLSPAGQWGDSRRWSEMGTGWQRAENEVRELSREVAGRAVAVVREISGAPWRPRPEERVGVLLFGSGAGGRPLDANAVARLVATNPGQYETITVTSQPGVEEVRELLRRARDWDRVLVFILGRGETSDTLRLVLRELDRLERPVAAISLLAPASLPPLARLERHLVAFGCGDAALRAAVDCLGGRREARGILPWSPG